MARKKPGLNKRSESLSSSSSNDSQSKKRVKTTNNTDDQINDYVVPKTGMPVQLNVNTNSNDTSIEDSFEKTKDFLGKIITTAQFTEMLSNSNNEETAITNAPTINNIVVNKDSDLKETEKNVSLLNSEETEKKTKPTETKTNLIDKIVLAVTTGNVNNDTSTPPTIGRIFISPQKNINNTTEKKPSSKSQLFTNKNEANKKKPIKNSKDKSKQEDAVGGNENEDSDDDFKKFQKKVTASQDKGKYDTLTSADIFMISNYCRDSLWRRAKFLNDRQLTLEFEKACASASIRVEDHNRKYVDVLSLISSNMNYRRSYSTKLVRDLLTGK
jgi:hypothetical protein